MMLLFVWGRLRYDMAAVLTLLAALALAMMMPVAFQMATRSKASPATFLMPMSFASLLGGLIARDRRAAAALGAVALILATAVGAGCDFLTPIGHQCNTLAMGAGGYRFGDYARLGAPLSLLVLIVGTGLIMAVWPVC